MRKQLALFAILFLQITYSAFSQNVSGKITSKNEPVPFASVYIKNGTIGVTANADGYYELNIPIGKTIIEVSSQGFRKTSKQITTKPDEKINLNFELFEDVLGLDEVVISATRNRVERKETPVVVSTIKPRLLTATQSASMADGLNYAPGVRVETNCQNCGFTQVRLNGLDGGYTQVLLNSRPVFTSLIGVYGLEQIPTNIIERIEVVRSGGSALYGSSAIAGTVNVITKDPVLNTWEIGSNFAFIDGKSIDRTLTFNTSVVADDLNSGVSLFGMNRNRESLDVNGDGFTELVKLKNTTVGAKAFVKPTEKSRISVNLNSIKEYRRGGDKLNLAPQFTDITEELDHDTFIGGADYEVYSKDDSGKFQIYTSASYTDRGSYYGGLGGGRTKQDSILANNAFGTTKDLAWVNGLQYTKSFKNKDILTVGTEYNFTSTEDKIEGYNRLVDQSVKSLGVYGQYEWKPSNKFTALIGARLDNVNVDGTYTIGTISRNVNVSQTTLSPRLTLSYQFTDALKFRGGYARGFRAPQAFNEDVHISSVGGEPQFVILSDNLKTEFSNAFTGSLNYSKSINLLQLDFLLEGFYTTLENPFTLVSTGSTLSNGSIVEEVRNGSGAKVYGTNFEFGISPNPKWQFQLGGTIQASKYNDPQILFETDGTTPGESNIVVNEFVRNPNFYGYINTSWIPNKKINIDLTGTYTGGMTVPRVISDTGFLRLNEVGDFFDLNLKLESHIDFNDNFMTTISAGVKNMFNAYQNDFDTGATRDSDYIYGPSAPRTFFIGIKFGKFH
ncbi:MULTISPECIES: TonB-dependent receptor [unclassified Tenacibaculum]|uniref:TonB-dependent receptor n=1 Tax=unclassified Tenacibaculum TaxID=2635139 RepID=UPI001F1FDF08|nr:MULTISPECIES: TonB-dependent receptor [unclassified Tenacibaculum]MCF2874544.1 TonB-dependent receptor [Tenacibaculum sp. Cn5-1]MCF2934390.1 TonB-dependent receptor [Tenacibaculum sp. Cn5-34]MCG7510600.1 TonB-dependent receptor [Tenacibaculum sp. Cn5-46]